MGWGPQAPEDVYRPAGCRATKPAVERPSLDQREPVTRVAEVSKRMPATSRKTCPSLAQIVTHLPLPASPHDIRGPDASGALRSPAAASVKDTEPDPPYPVSCELPCPPP